MEKINYTQVNFTQNVTRIAYISSRLFGIFFFEGKDLYQAGKGNMQIKLLKAFALANTQGKEMDEFNLITLLGDILFMPGPWRPINKWSGTKLTNVYRPEYRIEIMKLKCWTLPDHSKFFL